MKTEELFERIQKGLIKLQNRGEVVIMVDEEKGIFDVEVYELKDLPQRISVEKDEGYLMTGLPWRPLYFDLILRSKVNKEISIQSIRCRVRGNDVPLQVVDWRDGDEFATNGLELKGIGSIPPLGDTRISIPFNEYMCSRLPDQNRWGLDGFIELGSHLGSFRKTFSFRAVSLKEEHWRIVNQPAK